MRNEGLKRCQFTKLQVTRPTVLLNEIIAFSWHLFTNSSNQNLLAQRASGESVFGCWTENLLVPGKRTGGNFEPCVVLYDLIS